MNTQLVMVYGSLLKGLHNHPVISDGELLGEHETEGVFTMLSLGSFPGVIKGGHTKIKGEVYEVNDSTFKRLDSLEGYPTFYSRELISTPYSQDAWIYLLNHTHQHGTEKEVEDGDWKGYLDEEKE